MSFEIENGVNAGRDHHSDTECYYQQSMAQQQVTSPKVGVEDLLARMDRLRKLARSQRLQSYASRHKQQSFAF